jgi:hypothetical protein
MNGNTHAITRKKAMASLGFVTVQGADDKLGQFLGQVIK